MAEKALALIQEAYIKGVSPSVDTVQAMASGISKSQSRDRR